MLKVEIDKKKKKTKSLRPILKQLNIEEQN